MFIEYMSSYISPTNTFCYSMQLTQRLAKEIASKKHKVIRGFPCGITAYQIEESKARIVAKPETSESLINTLCGLTAAFASGVLPSLAPLEVCGTADPGVLPESEWIPIMISNGVFVYPSCNLKKGHLVPNNAGIVFKHARLRHSWKPPYLRPEFIARGRVFTVTPYGICGVEMRPGSSDVISSLHDIAETMISLAKHKYFCTDMKLQNWVRLNDKAVLIDVDQIASSCRRIHSVSFFNELWWMGRKQPDVFDIATWHPDVEATIKEATSNKRSTEHGYVATLEMYTLTRAIIALMGFQLGTGVEMPPELLVDKADEIRWDCYVGTKYFDEYLCIV